MSYIANSDADKQAMLKEIGVSRFEELIDFIPEEHRVKGSLNIPKALSEYEIGLHMNELADKNITGISFLGGGAYDHYIPAAVRHILWRPEFYTAYTPYQAEVSQGTLQANFEYQSMICRLTGMEVANASMYDGGSALAEAVLMALGHTRKRRILVCPGLNPNYLQIIETYILNMDAEIVKLPEDEGTLDQEAIKSYLDDDTAAVVVQNPNYFGIIQDLNGLADAIHEKKALFIQFVDPISLALLTPPGELGADIVISEGQALGNALNFGGPYLGIFATTKKLVRKMPGRITAQTVDLEGRRAFVNALQTREQHIRREKATSNICTNSQLCALAAVVYLSLMGESGFRQVAEASFYKSHYLAEQIEKLPGYKLKFNKPFFKEFVVETPVPARKIIDELADKGIFAGISLSHIGMENGLLIAVTEKRTRAEMDLLVSALAKY